MKGGRAPIPSIFYAEFLYLINERWELSFSKGSVGLSSEVTIRSDGLFGEHAGPGKLGDVDDQKAFCVTKQDDKCKKLMIELCCDRDAVK